MAGSSERKQSDAGTRLRRLRRVAFSLVPLLLLIAVGELALRALGADQPNFRSKLPAELFGAMQADEELFWSQPPHIHKLLPTAYGSMQLRTNSLGLRGSEEFAAKQPHEFRILSLGESSTFGAFVSDDETYSARLQAKLNRESSKQNYRVINAGVSAYSSFQSLIYLQKRGLALEPDLVLFYHEFNDFLPSSLRSSSNTEIGIALTDRELYESERESFSRLLLANSAIFRFASYQLAAYRLGQLMQGERQVRGGEIGLPKVGGSPYVEQFLGGDSHAVKLNDDALPRRVPSQERSEILAELFALCRDQDIELVIIHPAYRRSSPHVCELTRFTLRNDVMTFEAFDVLHPAGRAVEDMYLDEVHPTPEGHDLLADGLAHFLREKRLLDRE